jgi:hypothetical protein
MGKPARLSIRTTEIRAYTLHPIKKEDIRGEQEAPISTLIKERKDIDNPANHKGPILRSYLRQPTLWKGTPRLRR